jgi:hypothetical protein
MPVSVEVPWTGVKMPERACKVHRREDTTKCYLAAYPQLAVVCT